VSILTLRTLHALRWMETVVESAWFGLFMTITETGRRVYIHSFAGVTA